jgi:type IV pilus assembly protein PilV
MKFPQITGQAHYGFALVEVLVTIVILAFGLLGLVGLQAKIQVAEVESFQRTQAIQLLSDMADRISANRWQAAAYVTASPIGTGDSQAAHFDCTTVAMGKTRDLCEWSNALKGYAEQKSTVDVGAMAGARGCIEQIQAFNPAVCAPGVYRVTVVWQGLTQTVVSGLTCANTGLYGGESYRRASAARVTVGEPTCTVPGSSGP